MRLLLLDLDGTLIDRDAAFARAVADVLDAAGLPPSDLPWWMQQDRSGYRPRTELAAAVTQRYGPAVEAGALSALLAGGGAEHARTTERVRRALRNARSAGWRAIVVTNGPTRQQERKLTAAGLDRLVDGWVVSESVGHRKPDAAIFAAAIEMARALPDGSRDSGPGAASGRPVASGAVDRIWMIGDSAPHDVAGAVASSIATVWISHGRRWVDRTVHPTRIAGDCAHAIDCVLADPEPDAPPGAGTTAP